MEQARIARRHQHDYGPGLFQQTDKLLQIIARLDGAVPHLVVHEVLGLLGGPVIRGHGKPMVRHVQDKIAAHNSQANQTDVTSLIAHKSLHLLNVQGSKLFEV